MYGLVYGEGYDPMRGKRKAETPHTPGPDIAIDPF
jgi:hypothetical protein